MRAVVQRVSSASVEVNGAIVGQCEVGLLLLVAVHKDDTASNASKLADRIIGLRIFNDHEGKINLALAQVEGAEILAISNFTVYGDCQKSRRPSFTDSAGFEQGKVLFEAFVRELHALGAVVSTGEFGAEMQVKLVNDGPVTVIIDA